MTVAELGRRMSSTEFTDWLAYADVEPFGPLADGAAAAWLANVNRDPKKRPEALSTADALGAFAFDRPGPQPQDEAAVMARDRTWAATMRRAAKTRRRRAP